MLLYKITASNIYKEFQFLIKFNEKVKINTKRQKNLQGKNQRNVKEPIQTKKA